MSCREEVFHLILEQALREAQLYHGTSKDFEKLKLNKDGILWLALEERIAQGYVGWTDQSTDGFVWKIELNPKANLVSLADLHDPAIEALRQSIQVQRWMITGRKTIPDEEWLQHFTDFGVLETRGTVPLLKHHKVDGVYVEKDVVGHGGERHRSLALLSVSKKTIFSVTRETYKKPP